MWHRAPPLPSSNLSCGSATPQHDRPWPATASSRNSGSRVAPQTPGSTYFVQETWASQQGSSCSSTVVPNRSSVLNKSGVYGYTGGDHNGSAEVSPMSSPRCPTFGELDFASICDRVLVMQRPWKLPTKLDIHRNNAAEAADYLRGTYDWRSQIFSIDNKTSGHAPSDTMRGFAEFRDQALHFRMGEGNLRQAPPPMSLLCSFCRSVLFWRHLDRRKNVTVLQINEHASAIVLLFMAALLLALDVVPNRMDAVKWLAASCTSDGPPRKPSSTVTWIDHMSWAPSLRRYLFYCEKLFRGGRRATKGRLCILQLDVKRFAKGLSQDDVPDIQVEIHAGVYDEDRACTDFHLVTDRSSYNVRHSSPEEGCLLIDLSPPGKQPLWVEGDVAIVIKLWSRPHVSCRYFFHTDFIESDGYLPLMREDLDIDKDSANDIPQDIFVSVVLSEEAPDGVADVVPISTRQVLPLPKDRPAADKGDFSRHHVVIPEAGLQRELVQKGWDEQNVNLAMQIRRNNRMEAVSFLCRYFPMSTHASASRLATLALAPQSQFTPTESEAALSESMTDGRDTHSLSVSTREVEVMSPSAQAVHVHVPIKVAEQQKPTEKKSVWRDLFARVKPATASSTNTSTTTAASGTSTASTSCHNKAVVAVHDTTAEVTAEVQAKSPPQNCQKQYYSLAEEFRDRPPALRTTASVAPGRRAPCPVPSVESQPAGIGDSRRSCAFDAEMNLPRHMDLKALPKAVQALRRSGRRTSVAVQQRQQNYGMAPGGMWMSPSSPMLHSLGSFPPTAAIPVASCPAPPPPGNAMLGIPFVQPSDSASCISSRSRRPSLDMSSLDVSTGEHIAHFEVVSGQTQSGVHLRSPCNSSALSTPTIPHAPSGMSATTRIAVLRSVESMADAEAAGSSNPPSPLGARVATPQQILLAIADPEPAAADGAAPTDLSKGKNKGKGKGKNPPPPTPQAKAAAAAAAAAAETAEATMVEVVEASTTAEGKGGKIGKGGGKTKGPPLPKGKGDGPPAPPGAKGGKGAPPPTPGGKGGPGKGAPSSKGKGGPVGKSGKGSVPAILPLGRKLHWKPIPDKNLDNTVWQEINTEDGETRRRQTGLPVDVLERLFKSAARDPSSAKARGGAARKKSAKNEVTILDNKRAQNAMIIFCGLGFEPSDLCKRLKTLNVEGLTLEALERCKEILPNDEETERLVAYRGELSALREVEQRIHPLAFMCRLGQRLQLMTFSVQLPQLSKELEQDINTLALATKQVRQSLLLKAILGLVLKLGNFVNHGARDEETKPTKGFSVDALPKLLEMKSPGHSNITMLHYVAFRILGPGSAMFQSNSSGDHEEMKTLQEELSHVRDAARIVPTALQKQLDSLTKDTNAVAAEFKFASKYEPEALEAMRELQKKGETRLDELTALFIECERQTLDLIHFFGEDPRTRTVNALLSVLQEFVEAFVVAAGDLRKQPKQFELLLMPEEPKQQEAETKNPPSGQQATNVSLESGAASAHPLAQSVQGIAEQSQATPATRMPEAEIRGSGGLAKDQVPDHPKMGVNETLVPKDSAHKDHSEDPGAHAAADVAEKSTKAAESSEKPDGESAVKAKVNDVCDFLGAEKLGAQEQKKLAGDSGTDLEEPPIAPPERSRSCTPNGTKRSYSAPRIPRILISRSRGASSDSRTATPATGIAVVDVEQHVLEDPPKPPPEGARMGEAASPRQMEVIVHQSNLGTPSPQLNPGAVPVVRRNSLCSPSPKPSPGEAPLRRASVGSVSPHPSPGVRIPPRPSPAKVTPKSTCELRADSPFAAIRAALSQQDEAPRLPQSRPVESYLLLPTPTPGVTVPDARSEQIPDMPVFGRVADVASKSPCSVASKSPHDGKSPVLRPSPPTVSVSPALSPRTKLADSVHEQSVSQKSDVYVDRQFTKNAQAKLTEKKGVSEFGGFAERRGAPQKLVTPIYAMDGKDDSPHPRSKSTLEFEYDACGDQGIYFEPGRRVIEPLQTPSTVLTQFFTMDEETDFQRGQQEEVPGGEKAEDVRNGGRQLQRQTSLDERYDAFEAMSKASLIGEKERRASMTAVGRAKNDVPAFVLNAGEKELSPDAQYKRSSSLDWQYDALDAGNAIAAVASAREASSALPSPQVISPLRVELDSPGCNSAVSPCYRLRDDGQLRCRLSPSTARRKTDCSLDMSADSDMFMATPMKSRVDSSLAYSIGTPDCSRVLDVQSGDAPIIRSSNSADVIFRFDDFAISNGLVNADTPLKDPAVASDHAPAASPYAEKCPGQLTSFPIYSLPDDAGSNANERAFETPKVAPVACRSTSDFITGAREDYVAVSKTWSDGAARSLEGELSFTTPHKRAAYSPGRNAEFHWITPRHGDMMTPLGQRASSLPAQENQARGMGASPGRPSMLVRGASASHLPDSISYGPQRSTRRSSDFFRPPWRPPV